MQEKKEKIIEDSQRTPCEVWTRVMGYFRPTSSYNKGKAAEYKDRKYFKEDTNQPNQDDI